MRRFKKYQRLEVVWRDITQESDWLKLSDVEKEPDDRAYTIGYFVKRDKQHLYLCHSRMSDRSDKTTIPIGAIEEIRELQIPV